MLEVNKIYCGNNMEVFPNSGSAGAAPQVDIETNKRLKALEGKNLEEKEIKIKEWTGEDQAEFKFND